MKTIDVGGWRIFVGEDYDLGELNVGKWMYFFAGDEGERFAEDMCELAVESGVVCEAKHTLIGDYGGTGVACFYGNGDDNEYHKRVISFFLEHEMIKRTKAGRLTNISFKYDEQTLMSEYGSSFEPKLRLSDFVDLVSGEFLE